MSAILIDFIYELDKSEHVEQCFAALSGAIEKLGYDSIAYAAMPLSRLSSTQTPIFLSSRHFNEHFLQNYLEDDLIQQDFTVERISQGSMDVMDWAKELKNDQLSKGQKNTIELAKHDYGIHNAISIPTQSNAELIAGCSIISEQNGRQFQLLNTQNLGILKALVQLFHDRVFSTPAFRQHFYLPIIQQFSNDEIKILRLIVSGQRLKMSEELCGISTTRAGNILSSLYRRLKINNASELAYLIGLHKLVETL